MLWAVNENKGCPHGKAVRDGVQVRPGIPGAARPVRARAVCEVGSRLAVL